MYEKVVKNRAEMTQAGPREISYLSAPLHIWWDITQQCNLSCKHCYSSAQKNVVGELTTEEVFAIINQLKEAQVGYVYILGGEPLIRPDFGLILEKFSQKDIPLMLNTNGWFMNEKWAQIIAHSSVKHLRFSVDGAVAATHDELRGVKGSFDRVINGIKICRMMNIPQISCSYTVTKKSIQEIHGTCKLLLELGVDAIQFGPLSPTGRANDHPELTLTPSDSNEVTQIIGQCIRQFGDRIQIYSVDGTYDRPYTRLAKRGLLKPDFMGCQAGRTCCCIDWKGDILPCILWRSPTAGSLRKTSFKGIWNNSPLFKNLRRFRGDEYVECKTCSYSNVCARECPLSPSQKTYTPKDRALRITALQSTDLRPCIESGESC
jgi:radical SAM protein with 4Fe4S-binding SPASM domain